MNERKDPNFELIKQGWPYAPWHVKWLAYFYVWRAVTWRKIWMFFLK